MFEGVNEYEISKNHSRNKCYYILGLFYITLSYSVGLINFIPSQKQITENVDNKDDDYNIETKKNLLIQTNLVIFNSLYLLNSSLITTLLIIALFNIRKIL